MEIDRFSAEWEKTNKMKFLRAVLFLGVACFIAISVSAQERGASAPPQKAAHAPFDIRNAEFKAWARRRDWRRPRIYKERVPSANSGVFAGQRPGHGYERSDFSRRQ